MSGAVGRGGLRERALQVEHGLQILAQRGHVLRDIELAAGADELVDGADAEEAALVDDADAVAEALAMLDSGAARVAEPDGAGGWQVNQWLKKAVLLYFRTHDNRLVGDGDTVAFSAGTTTWHVADALRRGHKDLTFITNSTNVALALQEGGWERIVLSGGSFRTPSDALVGPFADRTLKTLNADVLFLGVHGIHPDAGLTTPNTAEAETDRCLVEAAQRVVVVADHTKLGVVALAKIIPLDKVDTLVTDGRAEAKTLREIGLAGVHVVVAD